MNYLYLILGLILLVISGDFLVKGGVQIANHLGIPRLIVGLTVVSIGTSAPELFVSIGAALHQSPDLSIGNVIGSNIANIGFILGITTLICPMAISRETSKINLPIMLFASFLLWWIALDHSLSFENGLLLVLLLAGYILFLVYRSKKNKKEEIENPTISLPRAFLYILGASVGLYLGAELLVFSAQKIALSFGVSERIIGLTVLALGTSVPELATSVIAALKKQADISVGNIIGSNIFNIFCVLGVTSLIKPIHVNPDILDFDIFFMLGIALLLALTMLPLSNAKIKRYEGALLFLFYGIYTLLLFIQ